MIGRDDIGKDLFAQLVVGSRASLFVGVAVAVLVTVLAVLVGGIAAVGPDATPPTIACAATPTTLSPANHKLRRVHVTISASDNSGTVTVALVSVTSSQPDSGLGRGDIPTDIKGWTTGADDRDGLLRAEQFRTARVYTLTYRATDPAGNAATCQATVTVPKARPQ